MEGTKTNTQLSQHPHTTQARLDRLHGPSNWIFEEVLRAMQNAEELGGPEGDEYLALMQAIIQEAADRTTHFLDNRIRDVQRRRADAETDTDPVQFGLSWLSRFKLIHLEK